MKMIDDEIKRIEQLVSNIAVFRDRLRVKSHLLKMEAKDMWQKMDHELFGVQSRLESFRNTMRDTSEDVRLEANLAMLELKERWESLKDAYEEVSEKVEHAGEGFKGVFEHARVKAALARLEAKDEWEEKTRKLQQYLNTTTDKGFAEARKALEAVESGVRRLLTKIS